MRSQVEKSLNWAMLIIAFVAITIGYVRLDNNQSAITDLANRRANDNCLIERTSLKPLHDVIVFATKPADLTGLTPERVQVVSALNEQRAKARTDLLALFPTLHCHS